MQNMTHPAYAPAPQPAAAKRDKIFAFLFLIGCIFTADYGLLGGFRFGYTLSATVLALLYVIYAKDKKYTLYGTLCVTLAILSTTVFSLYTEPLMRLVLFGQFFLLFAAAICEMYDVSLFNAASWRAVGDWIRVIFVLPFTGMGKALPALFRKDPAASGKKGKGGSIILGILCAVPVLLIVVPLLVRADAAFAKFLSFLSLDSIPRILLSVIFGTVLFLFLFSHAFPTVRGLNRRAKKTLSQTVFLPAAPLLSFTGAISFFYILYLVSQISYFFGAFTGDTPGGFLPANYARRGFFEMCVICVINLIVLFAVILLSRRENGKIHRGVAGLCAFIDLFSIVLIGTAISKMILYIRRFGMTAKRLTTSAFMVVLLFVFLALLARLFIRRFPYMKCIVITTAVISIALGLADIDTTIAKYNVTAYQSGNLSRIDTYQLEQIGAAAVPYIERLATDKDPDVAAWAKQELQTRALYGIVTSFPTEEKEEPQEIRSFNLTVKRARNILKKYVPKDAAVNILKG